MFKNDTVSYLTYIMEVRYGFIIVDFPIDGFVAENIQDLELLPKVLIQILMALNLHLTAASFILLLLSVILSFYSMSCRPIPPTIDRPCVLSHPWLLYWYRMLYRSSTFEEIFPCLYLAECMFQQDQTWCGEIWNRQIIH